MAKKTPAELNEARKKKREEEARRKQEEIAEKRAIYERLMVLRAAKGKKEQLKSVLQGYYNEIDKLSKKAPAEQITELALKRINELIRQCKELLQGDPFIDSIDLFVAAGERPEHRDALLLLRDLRQGIERFENELGVLSRQVDGNDAALQRILNEIQ